jgi:hypothetical protein
VTGDWPDPGSLQLLFLIPRPYAPRPARDIQAQQTLRAEDRGAFAGALARPRGQPQRRSVADAERGDFGARAGKSIHRLAVSAAQTQRARTNNGIPYTASSFVVPLPRGNARSRSWRKTGSSGGDRITIPPKTAKSDLSPWIQIPPPAGSALERRRRPVLDLRVARQGGERQPREKVRDQQRDLIHRNTYSTFGWIVGLAEC